MRADANDTPRLSVTGLTKCFGGLVALDRFELVVGIGEVHALVGENGSGKSTFIKTLSGYHTPDAGTVEVDGMPLAFGSPEAARALGCRFVHQDLGLVETASVMDNLAFGVGFRTRLGTIRDRTARGQAREALARVGLEIDPRRPVEELSAALRTGVAVARALHETGSPAKLLVLDEPTANLPSGEVEQLLEIVRTAARHGIGVVYVSHRLDEVFDVADRVTVLRDGVRVATRAAAELSHRDLVKLLVGGELDEVRAASARVQARTEQPALAVRRLRSGVVRSLTVDARPGEIVGVAGITGSGRETALAAIYGASVREAGDILVNGGPLPPASPGESARRGIAFVPADRRHRAGFMELSARENIVITDLRPFWRRGRLRGGDERHEVERWFARLDIRPRDGAARPLATFSGGNQQKVLLAKWLRCEPAVLLADEPTQGVDIAAKADLHREFLRAAEQGAAVLVSSSDVDELVALCHRVVIMRRGAVTAELSGESLTQTNVNREVLGV